MADSDVPAGFKRVGNHPAELWSDAAFEHVFRLQEEEHKRDPDAFDLYIYNDFFGYACADLILREMLSVGAKAASTKERVKIATFRRLEALVLYMGNSNGADVFHTIEDGDLAEAIYNGYGALWLSYVLNLEKAAKPDNLSPTKPVDALNFENVVRTAAKVLRQYEGLEFVKNDPGDLERAMLRVLERNGMNGTPKKKLFLGESSEDDLDEEMDQDDDSEDEDEDSAAFVPATDVEVERIAKRWKLTPALQTLRYRALPADFKGRSWDISAWSEEELKEEREREKAIMKGFASN